MTSSLHADFLRTLLSSARPIHRLDAGNHTYDKPSTTVKRTRASVAVILRVSYAPTSHVPQTRESLSCSCLTSFHPTEDCFLGHHIYPSETQDFHGQLELLFIKRATRANDKWSGHTAFPGGHAEPGETPLQAVEREVFEEIGLYLSDASKFALLGTLDPRIFYLTRGPTQSKYEYIVTPFVYIQLSRTTPPLKLQTEEVAAVRWVPLSFFFEQDIIRRYARPMVRTNSELARMMLRFVGLEHFYVNSVLLPPQPNEEEHQRQLEFLLWGLTLGMTSELLVRVAGRRLKRPLNYPLAAVDNRVLNAAIRAVCAVHLARGRYHRPPPEAAVIAAAGVAILLMAMAFVVVCVMLLRRLQ